MPNGHEILDAEEFLEVVWGETPGWVDLPAKVGQYWVAFYTEWPADAVISRRIDSSLRDREDLYYSVAQFSDRGRRIEDVLPTAWLWADLDAVHPSEGAKLGLLPTIAVQSSPGRYQALWRLDRELKPKSTERVNRGLTYALGADRGGWDLTQVLRIPGTRNYKYDEAPAVEVLWYKPELIYKPAYVWAKVKEAVPEEELEGVGSVKLPRKPIPRRAQQLLYASSDTVVEGERSARLWELECLLAESGLSAEEIFELIRGCAWNKWRGSGSAGRARLRKDIRKAIAHVTAQTKGKHERTVDKDSASRTLDRGRDGGTDTARARDDSEDRGSESEDEPDGDLGRLPWISYSSFMAMAMEEPKWLIEDIWTAGSHGIIGGEPKTMKTGIALALGLSVASGLPFLNRYPVGVAGPVLMVQEENAPWMMQDRLRKFASYYGLISGQEAHVRPAGAGALGSTSIDLEFPSDVPLRLLNNFGYDMGIEEHRDMLEAEIAEVRPVLVVLDPLYLILPADGNSADELRPFLKWIIALRYKYDCAIAIVHHMGKAKMNTGGAPVRAGQRILGSTTLHGFSDSALYLTRRHEERDGWVSITMETEFRSMAPQSPIDIAMAMGPPGGLMMEADVGRRNLDAVLLDRVTQEPGITVKALAEMFEMERRAVLSHLRGGETEYTIKEEKRGRGKSQRVYLTSANGNHADAGTEDEGEEAED